MQSAQYIYKKETDKKEGKTNQKLHSKRNETKIQQVQNLAFVTCHAGLLEASKCHEGYNDAYVLSYSVSCSASSHAFAACA